MGRIGVFEVLVITEEIRRLILAGASTDELLNHAIKEGMMTMRHDGMIKVKQGLTAPYEVMRNVFSIGQTLGHRLTYKDDARLRPGPCG